MRKFEKQVSVFANWHEDTKSTIEKACDHDFRNWKLPRVVKDGTDVSYLLLKILYSISTFVKA